MAKTPPLPRSLTADDRRRVEELKGLVQRVDDLLELLKGGRRLVDPHATEARELFVALKTDLRAEVKRLAKLRRRGELRGFEETDYTHAIEQASADFTVKTNSAPGPAWFGELYDAHITLSYPLLGLGQKTERRR